MMMNEDNTNNTMATRQHHTNHTNHGTVENHKERRTNETR